jgi:DNA-binding response OmpR family regulator
MFLTALGAVHDKLTGFGVGADDYLPKPFDPLELVARVEVLFRRGPSAPSSNQADLALDPARHSMTCNEREVMLTPTEFRMLAAITSRPGQVVRRRAIAAAAWPSGGYVSDNSIDSYVRRIRKKLVDIDAPQELITVRGVGYTLR